MNVFCVVGRLQELPELRETSAGVKMSSVKLKVERPYANSEGIYESDILQVEVWRGLAETICHNVKTDDLLAVKGRIASYKVEKDDRTYYNYSFIAEKMDFLRN